MADFQHTKLYPFQNLGLRDLLLKYSLNFSLDVSQNIISYETKIVFQ